MTKSRPLRVDEIPALLEEHAYFSEHLSDYLSIEIGDVEILNGESDYNYDCNSNNDQVYNSQPDKKKSRIEAMRSLGPEKMFEFNRNDIYGKNKFG